MGFHHFSTELWGQAGGGWIAAGSEVQTWGSVPNVNGPNRAELQALEEPEGKGDLMREDSHRVVPVKVVGGEDGKLPVKVVHVGVRHTDPRDKRVAR